MIIKRRSVSLGVGARITRSRLSDQAYRYLKQLLMKGELDPGRRLILRDVARELRISVTPVREVLLQLVAEKSLEFGEHGVVAVPKLSESTCIELWRIRLLLEGDCAEAAAFNATPALVTVLKNEQARMALAKQERRLNDALRHNMEFHFALYRAADLPLMLSMIEDIWARSATYVHFFQHHHVEKRNALAKQGPHMHNTIIRAVAARDPAHVRKGIERDLLEIRDGVLNLLRRSPPPGSTLAAARSETRELRALSR